MSRSINRSRIADIPHTVNFASRADLVVPEDLKHTHGGELFLMHDSGGDKKRFLIFTTQRNLIYLSTCEQWLADGTFRSVPGIFLQLYSIHGLKNGKTLPLIYILAPNKTQRLYESVLEIIRAALPNYKPVRMMIDFEDAFMIAFKIKYSGVLLSGCFYHFSQCVWRHIQSCGLQKLYNTDITFAVNLRLLTALAFVPTADVVKCYELIVATDFYETHEDELDEFLLYFQGNWIGKPRHNKKKRENPRFEISVWNCYNAVVNDWLRTNNPTEGWHNRLNRGVSVHDATVGVFFNALRDEQVHTELCMTQINTGINVNNRRKEYRDYDERLKRVVLNYDSSDMLGYVKNVAKIISFN
ncbi:uncharacterized protein LOC103571517 [Microplitis demolitor]|uniref:uncharacterized protein LOC103571517 n=1 Tax=Microplitis demolitor TaxID=69319 RepID=UPI00235B67BC|nr:uncharacterized protein LOC103571517 [Microplitis demolitor]